MTIHPLLDVDKQKRARLYEKEKRRLGLGNVVLSLLLLLGFYYTGVSRWAAYSFPNQPFILAFLAYGFVFLALMMILGLPLHFYSSFVHEHKWQFSNQTVKTWFWELFKSFLVGLVLLYIVVGLLLWVMHRSPHLWWLVAGLVMAVVSVIFATLFPVVVLPIFNKYTPIEDDELTSALREILSRGGLKSSGFFKEDMSRQTKKENAFLAGLGKTRRVVLADNLLDNMTVPEIESIIAHEVGHYRHLHIWKSISVDTFQQVIVFFLLHQVMRSLFPAFLSSPRADLNLLPVMAILIGFLSGFLFGPIGRAISRRFEREADAYSLEAISDKQAFLTALAGLADRNLSNAYPEWWVKLLYYSHPPIGERLEMAEKSGSG